jgi:hypothetical protein
VKHATIAHINLDIAFALSRLDFDAIDNVAVLVFEFDFLDRAGDLSERGVTRLLRGDAREALQAFAFRAFCSVLLYRGAG